MKELLTYLAETTVCSAVLLAAYLLLLHRKAPFRWCRCALLGMLVVSALVPALRIPVWPAPDALPLLVGISELPEMEAVAVDAPAAPLRIEILLGIIYLTGAALLLGAILRQARAVRRLAAKACIPRENGLRIARVREPVAPFSFLNTVYLPDRCDPACERVIIAHEASHVRHRHSQERLSMEVQKALMWWNPFAWIAARQIVEVQEYEADREVLASGHDPATYADLLFRQLCGYRPDIANGLHDSLTKKRFRMITSFTPGSHRLLRLTGMFAVIAGLIVAFSFTARAGARSIESPTDTLGIVQSGQSVASVAAACPDQPSNGLPEELSKDNKPVIYCNGVEITAEQLDTLDQRRIHSVSIFKGEQATEKYGEKGRNGVIVLTMKPGFSKEKAPDVATTSAPEKDSMEFRLASITVPDLDTPDAESAPAQPRQIMAWIPVQYAENATGPNLSDMLILLDGHEISEEELRSLDKTNIDKIDLLKGENAVARYGERAKNGALLLTMTKDSESSSAEVMPRFAEQNSISPFRRWVQERIRYPEEALKRGAEGHVVVQFTVNKNGKIRDLTVLESPDEALSKEVIRVIASSPRWTPGMTAGKPQSVRMTLPLEFKASVPQASRHTPATACTSTSGQAVDVDEVHDTAEQMPVFQGGDLTNFRKWVVANLHYPDGNKEGLVVAQFVVERDGRVNHVEIIRSPDETLSKEVVRVLASSPAWEPGRQQGMSVRVSMILPVRFEK